MKKILLLTALVVLCAVPALALNIKNSKHNLGKTGDYSYKATDMSQICIFCHTPHNAVRNVPLWNRTNPAASGFRMYTASTSLNLDKGAMTDDSISLFCLSCHDGTAGLGARVANRAGGTITMSSETIGGKAKLGTDLTNDHPVNFSYGDVVTGDTTIKSSATSSTSGVRFYRSTGGTGKNAASDYMECASCHDVHGAGFPKFLRKSNDSSSLCLTCHNK